MASDISKLIRRINLALADSCISLKLKISIIVPVYNSEKYLKDCLDSCISQTLSDIEIICVDDCSTDNSLEILEEYKTKDSRVKVFYHETNKKQGAARNTGIKNAAGEYIWFIDSDDFIDKNACQLLYDTIKKHNVDLLSFCGISFSDADNGSQLFNGAFFQGLQFNKVFCPRKDWKRMSFYNICAVPWIYITRAEVVKNFRFREGVYRQDTDFALKLFSSIDSMICIPFTAYYRRWGTGSITQGEINKKLLEDSISVIVSLHDFVAKNKISQKHFLYRFMVEYIRNVKVLYESNKDLQPDNLKDLERFDKKYSAWKITIMFRKIKDIVKNRVFR